MQVGFLQLVLALLLAAGLGFLIAWLIRGQALTRSTTFAKSLELLLAGTTRDRDAAVERERARATAALAVQQEQAQRLAELEKELAHRELQVVAFREEAIQLARTREELGQRLARREQTLRELEASLADRGGERRPAAPDEERRLPGSRVTASERELAALVAAHENDLSQLEARYLDEAQAREGELVALRQQLRSLEAEQVARDAEFAARALAAETRVQEVERELRDGEIERTRLRKRVAELEPMIPGPGELEQQPEREPVPASPPARQDEAPTKSVQPSAGAAASDPTLGADPKVRSRRSRRREPDDLKLIPGIDPDIERALNRLGVTSFRQIARWKDKDIERMARKLGDTPERIRRDGWVESAGREHEGKYGRAP